MNEYKRCECGAIEPKPAPLKVEDEHGKLDHVPDTRKGIEDEELSDDPGLKEDYANIDAASVGQERSSKRWAFETLEGGDWVIRFETDEAISCTFDPKTVSVTCTYKPKNTPNHETK